MDKLIEFIQRILDWVVELLLWWPRKIWELVTDGLAAFIETIPAPEFMAEIGNFAAGIDPAIGYFAAPLNLATGLTFIFGALVLRFAIRRIPVIG